MAIESKNLLVAVKAYARGNALPLDASEVYESLADAQAYAQSATAYAGQTIKVLQDGKYISYVLNGSKGAYTLSKVGVDASEVKNFVQVVTALPETANAEQGVIYVNTTDNKGYIFNGTNFTTVFENVTTEDGKSLSEQIQEINNTLAEKANTNNPVFTGTVTLGQDPTADMEAATKQYVDRLIAGLNSFTIGVVDSSNPLPTEGYEVGQTFRVAEAGTYAGQVCEAGDLILVIKDYEAKAASNADFMVVQSNVDGAVTGPEASTDANVAVFDGITGKKIKDSTVTLASLQDAIAKAHEHTNKVILDSFTKTETELLAAAASDADTKLALKANVSDVYTTEQIDTKVSTINTTIDTLTKNVNTKVTANDVTKQISDRLGAIDEATTVKDYIDNAVGSGGTASAEAIATAKKEAIAASKTYTDTALTIVEF